MRAPSHATLIGALAPARDMPAVLRNVLLAVLGSVFVAASAQIQVPLWPVPITGQTFAVLIVGMAYGSRLGAATLALYLGEGAVGLPVFAKWASGPAAIIGPTGGYLVGFIFAAAAVGWLAERGWSRTVLSTIGAMVAGNLVIYACGLSWLTNFFAGPGAAHVAATGAETALGAAVVKGLLPFLLGDALKIALAACAMPLAWKLVRRLRP
ncbi:MAG: biotin transporter BioY [Alphaproteobacteria bacterium]